MSLKTYILALFILLLTTMRSASAEPLALHVGSEKQVLSQHFQVLIDRDRELIPEDMVKPSVDAQFRDMAGVDIYQITRGRFWMRVTLVNDSSHTVAYRLMNHVPYSDFIQLYEEVDGKVVFRGQRGDRAHAQPQDNDYRLPVFPLQLAPGPTTWYVLHDTMGPVTLKYSLMPEDVFVSATRSDYLLLGLLFGFVVVMVGYNIFLAIRLRAPSYYLYVGYIACFGVVQLIFTGTAQYLLPESALTTIFLNQGLIISAELTAIFGSLFALSFLNIKKNSPWLYRFMLGFYPLSILDFFLTFFAFDFSVSFVLFTNTWISVSLLIAGVQGCLRRYRPAYFYLAAWGFLIVGSMVTMGRIYGLLPDNSFTTWSQFVGGALEVMLLSLAMGDKMSLIQEEAHQEISKLASHLHDANALLKNHIENVEAIVNEKTRDIKSMLASIPQGIFMISSKDGFIMPEYSEHLTSILGTKAITGRSVRDVLLCRSDLSSDQLDQTETVLMSALGDSSLNFTVNQELLVKELLFTLPKATKVLELEWNAICDEKDQVDKILVTLRDVTAIREMERQRARQQSELEAIGKVLKVSGDKFNNFLDTCDDFMRSCEKTLTTEKNLNRDAINRVFMNVHTMKGMARTFFLDDLANAFHEFESQLEPFRHKLDAKVESERLMSYLQKAKKGIQFYAYISREKLGRKPLSKAEHDQHSWIRSKVQKLLGLDVSRLREDERHTLRQVIEGLEQRYALCLEKSLETILQSLPETANALGKAAPQVIFEHDEIRFSSEGQLLMERIFIHLLNNSVDHGIETIEERKALGKPRRGEIRVKTWIESGALMISIQDDGQGLNLKKIRQKAIEQNLSAGNETSITALANLIFEPGFSTKDEATLTSGRGVGMDAVRTYLLNSNSTIDLILQDKDRQPGDLQPIGFSFVMRLDKKLFIFPAAQKVNQVA